MVEFAAAALGSLASAIGSGVSSVGSALGIGGTAAAAGTAAATAGTVATTAATSSIGWGSILSGALAGGASLVSAMATMRQGQAQTDDYFNKSADALTDARSEDINAIGRQTGLKQDLLKSIGERDVAYAASGIDLSFGTPVQARLEVADDAARAIGDDSAATDMRVSRLKERAANYRLLGYEASKAARAKATGTILETAASAIRRG